MRTAAILPVKRFALAKQRLGASVADAAARRPGPRDGRGRAARAEPDRVDRAHDRRHRRATPSPRPRASMGALVVAGHRRGGPERGRRPSASRRALAEGIERVLCIPGDCPALDPAELDALLDQPVLAAGTPREPTPQVVIVPDRHGTGTNGLLLTPPDAIAPSFGPDSCERHRALARAAGAIWRIERPAVAAARHRHRRGPRGAARAALGAARPGPPHARRARPAANARDILSVDDRRLTGARSWPASSARGLSGLPEVRAGDDLAALIVAALDAAQPLRPCTTARWWRSPTRPSPRPRARSSRWRCPP